MVETAWTTFMTSVKTSLVPTDNPAKTDTKPTATWAALGGGQATYPTSFNGW